MSRGLLDMHPRATTPLATAQQWVWQAYHTYMFTCAQAPTHTYTHVCRFIHVPVCSQMHICMPTYAYTTHVHPPTTQMHTHTHRPSYSWHITVSCDPNSSTHGSRCPCEDDHVITSTSNNSVKSAEWQLVSHFIDRDADTPGSWLTHQSKSHSVIPLSSLHGPWAWP